MALLLCISCNLPRAAELYVWYWYCRYLEVQGQQRGPDDDLETVLEASHCHKARLLHYFPTSEGTEGAAAAAATAKAASPFEEAPQDWCGWHLDHGALTGELRLS